MFLTIRLQSTHQLVGHINGNLTKSGSWFLPSEKEIQRKELVVTLNRSLLENKIMSLSKPYQTAFASLLSKSKRI